MRTRTRPNTTDPQGCDRAVREGASNWSFKTALIVPTVIELIALE